MLYAATIGFFDGVHTGHRFVLEHLLKEAQKRDLHSLVVTFQQHPRSILDKQPLLLTTPAEREQQLFAQGIEQVVMLDFVVIREQTAREFMEHLYETHGVRCLLLGYDHHFGSDCLTDFDAYQRLGEEIGIEVVGLPEYQNTGLHISSTEIRKALLASDIEKANQLLGYPYTLTGTVVAGRQIGRQIGFPTANISLSTDKLIPKQGVWAVEVNGKYGILNIGSNPTVGGKTLSVEVHILDYEGDLYGSILQLHLLKYIREERTFDSLEALQEQIQEDIKEAFA